MPSDQLMRWGILGAGYIAGKFAEDVKRSATGSVAAVASTNAARGAEFGKRYGIGEVYGAYADLLADPDIDCVYIALPNHLHLPWVKACAEAGKHILCEKPLAMNAFQAGIAMESARRHGVVLLEGFMYRIHPQLTELVRIVREGHLGEIRLFEASFGGNRRGGLDNFRMQRAAGGGAVMDLGCYGVSLARLVAGIAAGQAYAEPVHLKAVAKLGVESGVDEWSSAVLKFDGALVATVTCANRVNLPTAVRLWGSEGSAELANPWAHMQDEVTEILIRKPGEEPEARRVDADRPIFALEADAFAEVVRSGSVPFPVVDLQESIANMRVLDTWRREIGLRYDVEGEGPPR